jgi:catechol 2,3-dioxygenase-like lactoylglutathione lyase family enzyme
MTPDKPAATTAPAAAGPLLHATLIVADMQRVQRAYAALGLVAVAQGEVNAAHARAWGQPALQGRRVLALAPGPNAPALLRLIEVPGAPPRPTRFSYGWLALEILVRDVDALAAALPAGHFEVVGAPADLDLSPAIRAMQLVGPAGEMLYLTQVKAPVPPFDLPLSRGLPLSQPIGPLFIAVLSTPSRAAALRAIAPLAPQSTLCFETKVTVLNRALGRPLETRWPLATAQFAGRSLFEIDEVVDAQVHAGHASGGLLGGLPSGLPSGPPSGLAWVTMVAPDGGGPLREISPGAWLETLPADNG